MSRAAAGQTVARRPATKAAKATQPAKLAKPAKPALAAPPPRQRGRRPGGALYRWIAQQIERDIGSGAFAVGSLLPTEVEFSQRLNVGRHTVREALRVLSQAGLIVRRAGSGSTVVSNGRQSVYAHAVANFDQWFTYPDSVRRRPIGVAKVVADAALAADLGLVPGSAWCCISALRTLDGVVAPLCWVDIYIQPRFARVTRRNAFNDSPVHEQIEAMFGVAIAEVEVGISAGRVPAHMAEALGVEADSPALLLVRRYRAADGELLQATRTVHPENRTVYAMKFRRAAASRYG